MKSDPFIQQVMADAEQASASPEEAPDGTGEAPFSYAVGDTVRLEDGKPFVIEEVGTFTIRLRDPSLAYPLIRAESRESFARLMERYPQTALSSYPGDKNHLPYDVVVQTLRTNEPEPPAPAAEPEKAPDEVLDEHPVSVQVNGEGRLSPMPGPPRSCLWGIQENLRRSAEFPHHG